MPWQIAPPLAIIAGAFALTGIANHYVHKGVTGKAPASESTARVVRCSHAFCWQARRVGMDEFDRLMVHAPVNAPLAAFAFRRRSD